jgi:alkylhydroperoxidase family enzyme
MDQLEPEFRQGLQAAVDAGVIASAVMPQIAAYNMPLMRKQMMSGQGPADMGVLLDPRLLELVRLRSAQIGGCQECADAKYGVTVSEDEAACLLTGDDQELTAREKLAIRYITLMHTDHHSIGDAFYQELATEFSVAEIVELGFYVAQNVGTHRLMHTWDLRGTDAPAIPFDPANIVTEVTA